MRKKVNPHFDLTFNTSIKNKSFGTSFFEDKFLRVLKILKLGGKETLTLGVHLVGRTRIQSLNYNFRGKNKPTDVLSFPIKNNPMVQTNQCGIIDFGDIFISFPIAQNQAKIEGQKLSDQLALLFVHGLLHLLGFDHERSPEGEQEMIALQNKIIKLLRKTTN
ncbi:MAG: rRNA maturation RNase YbeY [Candidatus Yanofskybacteria bacterium CG10_big_fil_rev_8_21_14_0_10_46_23]|uniref:Endoribonuclease YbeY n=1 Tax=Candidatus Yanofskybacteria bacterium CG10_big_fil_rev_8_21_14_0_10_46_23 TaxID=1975098 RepID=A0A2H0R3Y9_9BACT|nr:MAG: rRNA maturation RNase YbeY [Candidatus Yanofskybacteria bacterium CG10_big_fil_rev_8_21_14_0_10_46_23]